MALDDPTPPHGKQIDEVWGIQVPRKSERRAWPVAIKRMVAARVKDGQTIASISREIDVDACTVGKWVKAEDSSETAPGFVRVQAITQHLKRCHVASRCLNLRMHSPHCQHGSAFRRPHFWAQARRIDLGHPVCILTLLFFPSHSKNCDPAPLHGTGQAYLEVSMTRIPFVNAKFPDPQYTRYDLTKRFTAFWRKIHKSDFGGISEEGDSGLVGIATYNDDVVELVELVVPPGVTKRINRRATRLVELRRVRSPMAHLPEKDLMKLEAVRNGVDLVPIPSEHRADEIAAEIHTEYPWLAPATDVLWQAMRHSVQRGDIAFRIPPLILDGPPGIGKSTWTRDMAKLIGVPGIVIDATGEAAAFGITGL